MKNLRRLINSKTKPLVIPGVYDAIGAKIAEKKSRSSLFYLISLSVSAIYLCLIPLDKR